MRIGLAQINSRVGDIDGNTGRILECLQQSREQGIELLIFPELMLTGYPPEDLLYRPAFHIAIKKALQSIIENATDIALVIGYPRKAAEGLYNSCAMISNGELLATYDKIMLPNYGVFDEKRYFIAGDKPCLVEIGGVKAALSICEDIWSPGPAEMARAAGATLLININASPYHHDKFEERRQVLADRHGETGLAIIYVNLIGGQDELVFDGGSMVIDADGRTVFEAPRFAERIYTIEVESRGDTPPQLSTGETWKESQDEEEIIYKALVIAVRDYVRKNGFRGVVIGLSGGIDSALVSTIATDALGPDNVEVVLMPSRYTSAMSNDDSIQLAKNLGIGQHMIPIEKPIVAFNEILSPLFGDLPPDTTEENIQARCRGIILMALSNKGHKLVLATGNKSEMAVGYATLYGDMAGGYAPLKDVPKLLVYRLSRWLNRDHEVIPERIITRPPTAELREDQKDADSLPPYEILDPILERYIELDMTPQQIIADGFNRDDVLRVTRMVDLNEYKRRQAAPGVKISKRAFGRERRYPITSGYREY